MKFSHFTLLLLPLVGLTAAEPKSATNKSAPTVVKSAAENELLKLFPEGLEGMTPENRKHAIRFTLEIIKSFRQLGEAEVESPDVAIKKYCDRLNPIIAPLKSGNAVDKRAHAAALKLEEVFIYIAKEPPVAKPGVEEWPDKSLNKLIRMPSDLKQLRPEQLAQGISTLIMDYAKMVLGKKFADSDFSDFKKVQSILEHESKH